MAFRYDPTNGAVVPCLKPTGLVRWDPYSRLLRPRDCAFVAPVSYLQKLFYSDSSISGSSVLDTRSGLGSSRSPQPGRAYLFDGSNDYIDLGSSLPSVGNSFSISFWFKTSSSSQQGIISQYETTSNQRSVRVIISTTGTVGVYLSSNGTAETLYESTDNALDDGSWHHATITFEQSDLNFYIDGRLLGNHTTTESSAFDSSASWSIGSGFNSGSELFDGHLFDLRIFNLELSGPQRIYVTPLENTERLSLRLPTSSVMTLIQSLLSTQ